MTIDPIIPLFFQKDSLDDEGVDFILKRSLSPAVAIKMGVVTRNGRIYFAYTQDGKIVRYKHRSTVDKKDQKTSFLSEEESKSFKMPFFNQFKDPTSDDLIITEGEFDSIALTQLGACNVASLPNGAGSVESVFRNQYEFLQQFRYIYIAFDMDEAGRQAAEKALRLLSPSKYRRINFPCKDANDWIKENDYLELADLEKLMANATKAETPCITHMINVPDEFYTAVDLGIKSGWSGLDLILGGMRTGEVTVISADTGSGKTTFCINLMKNLADAGQGIWINSYEMHPKMIHRKMAGLVLKKPMKTAEFTLAQKEEYLKWLKAKNCHLNVANTKVDLEILRKQMELAVKVYDINFVLLDHLDYIYSTGKKKTTLENIDDAIREIHSLAMEFNIGILLVVHPKQIPADRVITMSDLKGSSSIKQYADNIIILTRKDLNDQNDINRLEIKVCKNRLCGIVSSFSLRYIPEIDGYKEGLD